MRRSLSLSKHLLPSAILALCTSWAVDAAAVPSVDERSDSPPFPHLAYALSHPHERGSIELIARAGYPLPQSHQLARRVIANNDHPIALGDTSVPLPPLLLIFGALGLALLLLIYVLISLWPSSLTSHGRLVMEERARAKTELRLRGGGPRSSLLPPAGTPGGKRSSRPNGQRPPAGPAGHQVCQSKTFSSVANGKRRDTSMGTLMDAQPSTTTMLALPALNASDSASGSGSSAAGSTSDVSRPKGGFRGLPGKVVERAADGLKRASTIGRGTDLARGRSLKSNRVTAVYPNAVDRAYDGHGSMGERCEYIGHPLDGGSELRRHVTDPSGGLAASRRNSAMSMLDSSSGEGSPRSGAIDNTQSGSRWSSYYNPQSPLQPVSSPGFTSSHVMLPSMSGSIAHGDMSPGSSRTHVDRSPPSGHRAYELDQDALAATQRSGLLAGNGIPAALQPGARRGRYASP